MNRRAHIITAANNKGGTCKTTTAIAVCAEMAARGLRVLLVDTDSQCNATQSMPQQDGAADTYNMLHGVTGKPTAIAPNFDGIRSSRDMAVIELNLTALKTGNAIRDILQPFMQDYDVIMIDTPPATSLLTLNALKCADFVLIPLQTSAYSLQGVAEITNRLQTLNDGVGMGIVLTLYDRRKIVHRQLQTLLCKQYGAAVMRTAIRNCVAAVEAPMFGKLLRDYAPTATATQDYAALTTEIIERLKL